MFALRSKRFLPLLLILGASLGTGKALAGQESTVFRFDPKEKSFIRTSTTLRVDDGFISADKTKLDPGSPAYQALIQKRSYVGEVTLFGQACNSNYAPMTNANGELTGALFVATDCRKP